MIELKVTAEQPSDLSAQITGLAALFSGASQLAVAAGTTATAPANEPDVGAVRERGKPAPGSGRSRRTKEEIAEDEAAERAESEQATEPQEPESEAPPAETKTDAPPASRDEVRAAIVGAAAKLDQSKRGEFVQTLLAPFGVKKLGELHDDKLSDLMAAVQALDETDSALD